MKGKIFNAQEVQAFVKEKTGTLPALIMTLDHILKGLEPIFRNEYHKMIFVDEKLLFICAEEPICQFSWQFKKTFNEQSDKTQLAIAKLLGYQSTSNNS